MQGISDIITIPGLVNVDFADVKAIMCNSGTAMLGVGVSSGRNRAEEAALVRIQALRTITGRDSLTAEPDAQEALAVRLTLWASCCCSAGCLRVGPGPSNIMRAGIFAKSTCRFSVRHFGLQAATSAPLIERSIERATGIVYNITGGSDLTLQEVNR